MRPPCSQRMPCSPCFECWPSGRLQSGPRPGPPGPHPRVAPSMRLSLTAATPVLPAVHPCTHGREARSSLHGRLTACSILWQAPKDLTTPALPTAGDAIPPGDVPSPSASLPCVTSMASTQVCASLCPCPTICSPPPPSQRAVLTMDPLPLSAGSLVPRAACTFQGLGWGWGAVQDQIFFPLRFGKMESCCNELGSLTSGWFLLETNDHLMCFFPNRTMMLKMVLL